MGGMGVRKHASCETPDASRYELIYGFMTAHDLGKVERDDQYQQGVCRPQRLFNTRMTVLGFEECKPFSSTKPRFVPVFSSKNWCRL